MITFSSPAKNIAAGVRGPEAAFMIPTVLMAGPDSLQYDEVDRALASSRFRVVDLRKRKPCCPGGERDAHHIFGKSGRKRRIEGAINTTVRQGRSQFDKETLPLWVPTAATITPVCVVAPAEDIAENAAMAKA